MSFYWIEASSTAPARDSTLAGYLGRMTVVSLEIFHLETWNWTVEVWSSTYKKSWEPPPHPYELNSLEAPHSAATGIGALIIRIGSWGPFYYKYNKEAPKIV